MTPWPARESFDVLVVGRRLGLLLCAIALYCAAAGLTARWLQLGSIEYGTMATLINTFILSLLMSFRNSVAYKRWWEARGLWGQLTNDSRNLSAKCAAFVPADALADARLPELLTGFADALRRHLRDEPLRLQDVPGFERDEADPDHVPLFLAGRVFEVIAGWTKQGHVEPGVAWMLDVHARGLLEVCGGCEKIRNTPLSPSYKGLLRAGLVLNVLVEPWLSGPDGTFSGLPVFLLVCFFLFGVELIDSVVEEPFGHERDDLNLDRYCRTIRDDVEASLPLAQLPDEPRRRP
jgi:putative membrane protein